MIAALALAFALQTPIFTVTWDNVSLGDFGKFRLFLRKQPMRVQGALLGVTISVHEVDERDWSDEMNPDGVAFDDSVGITYQHAEVIMDAKTKRFGHQFGHVVWWLVLTDTERAAWPGSYEDWANDYEAVFTGTADAKTQQLIWSYFPGG